jgi:N,N'-diacetylchitobiose phosphorylase
MEYGFFDNTNKEYVIVRPDTPESWSNYLGSTGYGAIITNNAGGYSFYNSAASGRITRLRPNTIPMDQPGRYIYLHDKDSRDFWSASWQPVAKPLDLYQSVCRHGTGYTVIESDYSNIHTETRYFVPLGQNYECWHFMVKNSDKKKRSLRAFTFLEYVSNWQMWMDLINLQYSQYILTMDVVDSIIDHGTNLHLPPKPDDFEEGGQGRHTFMGIAGAKITGFDTDRKKFIGPYRTYANPLVVEKGICGNSIGVSDNGCGSLQVDLSLEPGETKEFTVVMGVGEAAKEGKKALSYYNNPAKSSEDFVHVRNYWHSKLNNFSVETPDAAVNNMVNMWSQYNCLVTYAWSRAASLVYSGERNGLGYRDTLQDILGVLHSIPDDAGKRLELMITGQVSTGGAMPVVKPFSHNPGYESLPEEEEYRSDDCLWMFNTIPAYVKETGNIGFYNKMLPYADKGKDSVLGHMRKAIEFNFDRIGAHGLPCGLKADWNDCLVLGQSGESVFVAFQLRYALMVYATICSRFKNNPEKEWASERMSELDKAIESNAWNGKWYIRAINDSGLRYGDLDSDEGNLWLNPQTWAVLSGHANPDRSKQILEQVYQQLFTDYGLMVCDPPYEKADLSVIKATLFNKGTKENSGVFCHTQGWAVIAEAMVGNGNRAFEYFKSYLPSAMNGKAEIREIEPYVYCQSTHSKYSPRYGASRLPWLSGAATWAMYAVSQYILGIQPDYDGIVLDPCIPSYWKLLSVRRLFRNKWLNIAIENQNENQKGAKQIILNGQAIKGNFIPFDQLTNENNIQIVMS